MTKAAVVERLNRTIKNRIFRYLTRDNTKKYIDVLPRILKNYNISFHRTIGMSPEKASQITSSVEKMKLYNKIYEPKESKKFSKKVYKVGDLVRISKHAGAFVRGYLPNFTEEVFKIRTVHKGTPNLYSIEDKTGVLIKGRFYAEEMVKFEGKISHI